MSKGGRQKGGHTPKISEHKDNDDDTNQAGGQQADDTPGGSQQSVHDPGKKEIEELKQKMAGQENKFGKMTEDLIGLKNEIANHKEAVETERQQREKLETKLKGEGKMREDVTNQIVGLKKQTKDDFGKMEERLKDFEEQAKKIEDLLRLQHRIEKLEEKMKNTYIGGFFILVLAIMLGVVFTMYCGQSDPPGPSPPRPIPIPDYEMKIQALESKLENVQKEFDHWKKKVVTSEGKINFLDEKGQDTNFMIILVVIIIMFIVVLVVMLMLRLKSTAAPGPTNISPGLRGGYEPSAILKNVKENCVKDNTVCVLHFNKESKDFCVNLTKVVESDSHKRKPYFLDNHGDILTIPRSKVIIVYVEKNQRNIILEDPDQELGDLRRTTVEAALKMGATVVVVYMHHEESRNLGNNELYCPKLQSVTRHHVLSKLEKQDGVFSVFDSYSDFQRQHLKKLISDSFIKK